ncbi:MAG: MarR family transcriptional regulator, partial [Pseudomonadota bacterium]
VTLAEHPESGREKLVQLSAKGEKVVQRMFKDGTRYLERIIEYLSDDEIDMVTHIFDRTASIFEDYPGPFRSAQAPDL